MGFDAEFATEIWSGLIVGIVMLAIKAYTKARSKVVTYFVHASSFSITPPNQQNFLVHTHSIVVLNAGRKAATNVRVSHSAQAACTSVFPTNTHYKYEQNANGTDDIVFPALRPKEQVTVSYLYYPPLTCGVINPAVRCDNELAKVVDVIPIPRPNAYLMRLIWALIAIGGFATVNFVLTYLPVLVSFLKAKQ